jgi:hypothetical protein
MAQWSHRLVRDKLGKLHFACVRFREFESCMSGMMGINNEGENIEEMRRLAKELLIACERAIIGPDGEDPDFEYDEECGDW